MRSFLATSNNQYIQDLALREGEYTFSALVKSGGKYSFSLLIGGVWQKFDAPTHTTSWRRIEHTFEANGLITKFNLISDYASGSNPIEVLEPMFESGSFTSDARLHELDVLEVISNAKLEAENAAKAYSDSELNAREVTIKAYADGIVDAEEARAIADAQAKVDALALVEEQARIALQTTMESYADGIVDAEEQARIDDVNTKLAAAKAYADSVSNLARTNAEAYADGKVDAEEARAIADATQKMNEAKAHAESIGLTIQNQVDNIGIRITAEEQKVVDLENKTGAFAEPSINPAENTLLAGSMLVGNSSGTNAGISGLGSLPTSVRLWAGGTFANRSTANWVMRDDGVEERYTIYEGVRVLIERKGYYNGGYFSTLYNPHDGSVAKRTIVQNGFVTEQWYKDGVLVYEVGRNGIYYVSEILESYSLIRLLNLNSNAATSDFTIFHSTIRTNMWQKTSNPNQFELRGNKDTYLYNAGRNVYSDGNKQYEGYKNTQSKTDNITDGWYAFEALGMMMEDYLDPTIKIAELIRVQGGKIVQSGSTNIATTGYTFNQF